MTVYTNLPVYKASYDLLVELFRFTKNFSREYKYTIGESIKKETIEMIIFILAGNRNTNGTFYNRGTNTNFWSSSEASATNAWKRNLNTSNTTVNRNDNNKENGFSVCCLRTGYAQELASV